MTSPIWYGFLFLFLFLFFVFVFVWFCCCCCCVFFLFVCLFCFVFLFFFLFCFCFWQYLSTNCVEGEITPLLLMHHCSLRQVYICTAPGNVLEVTPKWMPNGCLPRSILPVMKGTMKSLQTLYFSMYLLPVLVGYPRGLLSPKSYVYVPAGPRKSVIPYRPTNFLPNFTHRYTILERKAPDFDQIGCFLH